MCELVVEFVWESSAGVTPPVSLHYGVRCVPVNGATVEDVLMAVGEEIGYENILSASRMNKAVPLWWFL